jgi:RimJ/RimL family protein N-acetyltransferase
LAQNVTWPGFVQASGNRRTGPARPPGSAITDGATSFQLVEHLAVILGGERTPTSGDPARGIGGPDQRASRWQYERVGIDRDGFRFETERLRCGPWIEEAGRVGVDLERMVADLLTPHTTKLLPGAWHGEFTVERARTWIEEREADSTTLLVTEKTTSQPVGLVILAVVPQESGAGDLRIGYLVSETRQGLGIGTELLAGLVERARGVPAIGTLTGGVDPGNAASIRVLERAGFYRVDDQDRDGDQLLFRLDVGTEWDGYASIWDDDPTARAYASAAFSSLQELLRAGSVSLTGAHVLDFGCGTGLLTEYLADAGASVYALDASRPMLDVLRSKTRLIESGHVVTGTSLPRSGQAFRVVVCSSVCSFLDDYPATVAELVAMMEPGGLFVQWDWERTPGDDHGLARDEIVAALQGAGLIDVEVSIGFEIEAGGQRMAPLMGHGRRGAGSGQATPTRR